MEWRGCSGKNAILPDPGNHPGPRAAVPVLSLIHILDTSELKMTSKIAGKTVVQAQLRNLYGVNIIAISRNGWLTTDIKPEYVLDQDDTIVVIGDRDKIKRLADDL